MQPEHLDLHDSYGHHYVTLNVPAAEPPGEALPNSEIFRRLARATGARPPAPARVRRGGRARRARLPAAREAGITFERLRDDGALRVTGAGASRASPSGGFPTPSGRLRLLAPELAGQGVDPLVGYMPPHELEDARARQALPAGAALPRLALLPQLDVRVTAVARGRLGPPRVHLHPATRASAASRAARACASTTTAARSPPRP